MSANIWWAELRKVKLALLWVRIAGGWSPRETIWIRLTSRCWLRGESNAESKMVELLKFQISAALCEAARVRGGQWSARATLLPRHWSPFRLATDCNRFRGQFVPRSAIATICSITMSLLNWAALAQPGQRTILPRTMGSSQTRIRYTLHKINWFV